MKSPYAVLDLETTGLDPETHQVIEWACVVDRDWMTPTCLRRAGLTHDRPHHPVSDCEAVIGLIRRRFGR